MNYKGITPGLWIFFIFPPRCFNYNVMETYNFRWLEESLLSLGFRLMLCTRTPESFAAAREERLKVSGNPSQYDDLNLFVAEQERIKELSNKSILPILHLDVSSNSISQAADKVADWLEATGGLYMDSKSIYEISKLWSGFLSGVDHHLLWILFWLVVQLNYSKLKIKTILAFPSMNHPNGWFSILTNDFLLI